MKGKLLRDVNVHSKGIVHQWFADERAILRLDIWFGSHSMEVFCCGQPVMFGG